MPTTPMDPRHDSPALKLLQDDDGNYVIARLLDHRVQPFDDLYGDEFAAFMEALELSERTALLVPVVLSADGRLIDGSQRLRALQEHGETVVPWWDTRIDNVTGLVDCEVQAVVLQFNRRNLPGPMRAKLIREWQKKRGWNQTEIGKKFGVTQSAIAHLLRYYPEVDPLAAEMPKAPVPAGTGGDDDGDGDDETGGMHVDPRRTVPYWAGEGRGPKASNAAAHAYGDHEFAESDPYIIGAVEEMSRNLIETINEFRIAAGWKPVTATPRVNTAGENIVNPTTGLDDPPVDSPF